MLVTRNRLTITSVIGILCAPTILLSTDASAQNLSDRIEAVARQRQAAASKDTSKSQLLGTLLYTDMSVNFEQTPARDAFEYIKSVMGVDLVVRYNDDRTGFGVDPDAEITLQVSNKPALTIIEMVLQQCSDLEPCTWQLRNGYIEVGTKERLSVPASRELRMYPIRDLLFEIPYFDNAPKFDLNSSITQGGGGGGAGGGGGGGNIFGEPGEEPERQSEDEKVQQIVDIILEVVEPEMWIENGGDSASIRYYQGVLIVRAPDFVHRQLGGYPFAAKRNIRKTSSRQGTGGRYVTFSAPISIVENVKFRGTTVTGSAGGSGR